MKKSSPAFLGILAIISCGLSVTLPPLIYALGHLLELTQNPYELEQACSLVFIGFILGSLIFGAAGWQQRLSKISLGISVFISFSALIYSLIPNHDLPRNPSGQGNPSSAPNSNSPGF